MRGATAEKQDWVLRVLKFDVNATVGSGHKPDLLTLWRDAKDEVDSRLAILQRALEADEDPDFGTLAKSSLFDLGTNENVTLLASLMDYQKATGSEMPVVAASVQQAAERYIGLLNKSSIPAILDDNPFDVEVGMAHTLGSALAQIQAAAK